MSSVNFNNNSIGMISSSAKVNEKSNLKEISSRIISDWLRSIPTNCNPTKDIILSIQLEHDPLPPLPSQSTTPISSLDSSPELTNYSIQLSPTLAPAVVLALLGLKEPTEQADSEFTGVAPTQTGMTATSTAAAAASTGPASTATGMASITNKSKK